MTSQWPVTNHAVNLRGFAGGRNADGTSTVTTVPMAIPRFKFTWFADLVPSDTSGITNLASEGLTNGHLYTHLKSVDHPKPTFKTDTLNSYNRRYKIQTKMELGPMSMTFHDDTTSFATALVKEMINHAHYTGDIGSGDVSTVQQNLNNGLNQYTPGTSGIRSFVNPDRSGVENRPSLGMRIQGCARTYFSHIIIYDLGTEADSINVYIYQNPFLVGVEHTALDNYDRTGFGEITLNFEYENYFFMVGQPQSQIKSYVDQILHTQSPDQKVRTPHASQSSAFTNSMNWAAQCLAQCGEIAPVITTTDNSGGPVTNAPADPNDESTDPELDGPDQGNGSYSFFTSKLPSQGGDPNSPALSATETVTYLGDKLQRAYDNYIKTYSQLTVDTPQAQIRRVEIAQIQTQLNAATALSNSLNSNPAPADAIQNTVSVFSATTPAQTVGVLSSTGSRLPISASPTVLPPIPAAGAVPTYAIPDPSVSFATFNQNYMKTFRAGVPN